MGNRAVIKFKGDDSKSGLYLHWEGGPGSVCGFLHAMLERGWTRSDYALARLASVAVEYFDLNGIDEGLSIGIIDDPAEWADGADNGLYEVAIVDGKMSVKHGEFNYIISKGTELPSGLIAKYDKDSFHRISLALTGSRNLRAVVYGLESEYKLKSDQGYAHKVIMGALALAAALETKVMHV